MEFKGERGGGRVSGALGRVDAVAQDYVLKDSSLTEVDPKLGEGGAREYVGGSGVGRGGEWLSSRKDCGGEVDRSGNDESGFSIAVRGFS